MSAKYDIVIIGGGAAGFFAAIEAAGTGKKVAIFERSAKLLAKVKISGGGRCNVTHACFDNAELATYYPRGSRQLRKAFGQFNAESTVNWFAKRGVKFYTLPDNCMFPESNSSQTIIDCFLREAQAKKIEIRTGMHVNKLEPLKNAFHIHLAEEIVYTRKVIVATGGSPKRSGLAWLDNLELDIVEPVPSLFTFNMPGNPVTELMGNVVEEARVRVEGTKLAASGPLLVTHWGMSGPAVLKLSAWGARILAERNYDFAILVNWLNDAREEQVQERIARCEKEAGGKMMCNFNPFPLTNRLFENLLFRSKINGQTRWGELGKKNRQVLINTLINDRYPVKGKTTFKEEFVTAGGIALGEIDFKTMQSKKYPGLYFAGEVLDIDGITGGFNFQAAWTTGFIAGKNAAQNYQLTLHTHTET